MVSSTDPVGCLLQRWTSAVRRGAPTALVLLVACGAEPAPASHLASDSYVDGASTPGGSFALTAHEIRAASPDTCGSQGFATMALADALTQVRTAAVYVTSSAQRQGIAELQIMIIERIESEPDSVIRAAVWQLIDGSAPTIESEGEYLERRLSSYRDRYTSLPDLEERLAEQRNGSYRRRMERVVKLLDPRTPKSCARHLRLPLHAAALRAQAL